ncbi:signal recognition particle-docking protein FtsY [Luteimonas changyuni]|uniref:signal recognition particle-docking protein FtsY n=1 Tax=Luteimonas sp. MJ145 TaxID=3129234 RepID=UPI0031BA58EC
MVSFFRRWKPDADKAKQGKDDGTASSASSAAAEAIEAARAMGAAAADPAPVQPPPMSQPLPPTPVPDTAPALVEAATAANAPPAPADSAPALVGAATAANAPSAPAESAPALVGAAIAANAPSALVEPSTAADTSSTTQAKPAAAPGKPGWRERLSGSGIARGLGGLFARNPRLDDDLLDEIETALITADVGVAATTGLVESLRKRMKAREFADVPALRNALRADLIALLEPVARPLAIDAANRPFVILTVGVNGVGKTTTIGKLAKRFKDEGRGVMLAAGDTFRAAAVAQLQAWGERNGVTVIAQGQDADAASVAFDALQAARARGSDILIADTAGRLHTQQGLMAELSKIKRVLGKLDGGAPHEVLMVIDGTTGQNALSQLRHFHAAAGVTGLVVTKLDGTAKGGVVFALAREFNIPIRFAGIGERPEDLRVFDAEAFVDALLPEALGA